MTPHLPPALIPSKPLMRRTFGVLLLAAALCACDAGTAAPPARPASVPPEALWVGGMDGGVFVVVQPPAAGAARTQYRGSVWYAHGAVWYRGAMRLEPAGAPALAVGDVTQYQGWDGSRLLLSGDRSLVATGGRMK